MKNKRPVFLDITKIQYPPAAIASILHRISGILLFLAIPLILWLLDRSLNSADSYRQLINFIANPGMKILLWIALSALIYHFIAGIRHLFMDAGIGEEKISGAITAVAVIVLSALLIIVAGIWLWLY